MLTAHRQAPVGNFRSALLKAWALFTGFFAIPELSAELI